MKRLGLIVAAVIILAVVAGGIARNRYLQFLDTPLSLPESGHILQVEPGTTGREVVARLSALGFTQAGWEWKVLMRLESGLIHAGEYRLDAGIGPRALLQILASGKVIQYRFTVVEGWTFAQLLDALGRDQVLVRTHDLQSKDGVESWLASQEIDHPEGWFLPETYQFTRGDRDLDLLARAHVAMKAALNEAWKSRNLDLPLDSPYELLILASIIEKETARDDERRQISGVFVRRLKRGMRLQTDPTVIYGLGATYDGNIRRTDLERDTPYNTYTRHGLPPTPIAMPGRASLLAAGQPDDGDSLYFVADGDGGHTFSASFEEHQKAVNKLIGKG